MGAQGGPNLSKPPQNSQVQRAWNRSPQYGFRIFQLFSNGFDINFHCYNSQLGVIQYRLKQSLFFQAFLCLSKATKTVLNRLAIKKWLILSLYWITPSWGSYQWKFTSNPFEKSWKIQYPYWGDRFPALWTWLFLGGLERFGPPWAPILGVEGPTRW